MPFSPLAVLLLPILAMAICVQPQSVFAEPDEKRPSLPPGIRLGPYKTPDALQRKQPSNPSPRLPATKPAADNKEIATPQLRSMPSTRMLELRKKIESVFPRGVLGQIQLGAVAYSLDRDEVIYEHNADQLLIPASVSKLFTAYVALKKLKPTSSFVTSVWSQGPVSDGKLAGDLFLKGGGDPSLVSERLWMLVNELVRSGIKKISGDIVADSSYYDQERTPDTRPSYLTDQAYNAPVGALSFNFNTTTIYVKPGDQPGQLPVVYTDPENSYIDVVNQAVTGKPGTPNSVRVQRTKFVKGDIGDTVLLRGSIPVGNKELRFYRNIVNPSLYAAHMFRTFWEQRGLQMGGKIREGVVPARARQLLEFESLPLWQVVWGMNKFSNNFVADQILKKVGAETLGAPGSLEKGVRTLNDALAEIGISPKAYSINDGSGLTRKTKVTPNQIARVLKAAYSDLSISAEFIASLGVAGEDGTLRNRFPTQANDVTLRAKTGSLDGVASLAGYTRTADGENIAFAILLNDPKVRHGRMSPWVDKIASEFTKFTRK